MDRPKRILALCLALAVLCPGLAVQGAVFTSDVRVRLSLGEETSFSFTPVGEFTLQEAPELTVGNDELTVTVVGGQISIQLDGETVTQPSLTFLSGNYGERTDYIRLYNDDHGTCTYLGNLTFDVYEGYVRAINTLPLEQYLYGVVPHEMSNSFPIEALKAQAICARGYAVAKCSSYSSRAYDLGDTSSDQVYRGYASKNTRAIAAVDATKGQVLTYDGDIVETYYSASNGGQTERTGNVWENDLPYYINQDDPFDLANASSLEEKSFIPETYTPETMALMDPFVLLALEQAAYEAAGQEVELVATVSVEPQDPQYDPPSRSYQTVAVTLLVRGLGEGEAETTGQLTVKLELESLRYGSFENTLGRLNASKTRLRLRGAERGVYMAGDTTYPGWYITERRYGHGVGLSQRGAQERARAGESYQEILAFYYTDTTLHTVGSYETAPKLSSEDYTVKSWGVSGIKLDTEVDSLLQNLSSKGELQVVTGKGRQAEGKVCTGYYVRTIYADGTAFFDLPIVLFGDLNGDGAITAEDVTSLQNHLIRASLLTGPRLRAADVNHDGEVDLQDLFRLIQYVNGDAKISQED